MRPYHALSVSKGPAVMKESVEDQGIGIEGYHKVSKRQTHHEHITWRGKLTTLRLSFPKTIQISLHINRFLNTLHNYLCTCSKCSFHPASIYIENCTSGQNLSGGRPADFHDCFWVLKISTSNLSSNQFALLCLVSCTVKTE